MTPRRIGYIVNPAAAAGRALPRWHAARAELWRRGLAGPEHLCGKPGDGIAQARNLAATADVMVAIGGDGTVSEVASGLLQSRAAACLAILPFGTGNDIASQVGVRTLAQAMDLLAHGQPRLMDAIEVQYLDETGPTIRHALCFASIGFAGELLRQTTPAIKRWFGQRCCYSVGFLRALATYRPPQVRVQTEAAAFAGRWLHICAGNLERAGGGAMRLSPGARCDDGQLDICLIEAMSRLATAWHFPKLLRGTFVGHPRVRYFPGTQLVLETNHPVPLQLDGDLIGTTPARFCLQPARLPVLIPPP
jgi:YegS/Rv2252/BmrU family lipid kinase